MDFFQGSDEEWSVEVPPPVGMSSRLTQKMKVQPTDPGDKDTPMEIEHEEMLVIKSDAGEGLLIINVQAYTLVVDNYWCVVSVVMQNAVTSRILQETYSLSLEGMCCYGYYAFFMK